MLSRIREHSGVVSVVRSWHRMTELPDEGEQVEKNGDLCELLFCCDRRPTK